MDIPVHIAAAAVTCQAALALDPDSSQPRMRMWVFGVGYFALGALSHLFLDAIPHYDVLYKIEKPLLIEFLPRLVWTLLKVGVFSLPIIIMFLYFTREHPGYALAALAGGLYPDFEKGAYLSSYLPRSLVLFPFHSCAYSSAGWEIEYRYALIAAEIGLLVGLLGLIYWFGQRQCAQYANPGCSFKAWWQRNPSYFHLIRFYHPEENRRSILITTVDHAVSFQPCRCLCVIRCRMVSASSSGLSVHVPKTWIEQLPPRLPYDDKIAHFFMMGLLALLVNLSLHASSFRIGRLKMLKGSLLVFTFIAIEEGTHMLFPARTFPGQI